MCQKEKLQVCAWQNGVGWVKGVVDPQRWTKQYELDTPEEMAEWDRKHGTVKEMAMMQNDGPRLKIIPEDDESGIFRRPEPEDPLDEQAYWERRKEMTIEDRYRKAVLLLKLMPLTASDPSDEDHVSVSKAAVHLITEFLVETKAWASENKPKENDDASVSERD